MSSWDEPVGPIDLSLDVTDALPSEVTQGSRAVISAWAFIPDDLALLGDRPSVIVLTNGGSYDKRYHHAVVSGHEGYSAAEQLAALGHIVLLPDHLGAGGSSRMPVQKLATRQVVAAANHAAVEQFRALLSAGEVTPALPPLAKVFVAGGGHSMGGMLATIQQANHATYDALLVLGYTAQGVHGTMNGRKFAYAELMPKGEAEVPDYTINDRGAQRQNFHWSDVPDEVIAYDDTLNSETPSQIGRISIQTGIIAAEAAQVRCPVFVGLGEQDVSPDPAAEALFFRNSSDFTIYQLPRSAHCQVFASTRALFWKRISGWVKGLA